MFLGSFINWLIWNAYFNIIAALISVKSCRQVWSKCWLLFWTLGIIRPILYEFQEEIVLIATVSGIVLWLHFFEQLVSHLTVWRHSTSLTSTSTLTFIFLAGPTFGGELTLPSPSTPPPPPPSSPACILHSSFTSKDLAPRPLCPDDLSVEFFLLKDHHVFGGCGLAVAVSLVLFLT